MIQQATSAYEPAIATQARIAAQAAHRHEQRLADLAAQQAADASQREEDLRDQRAAAGAEATRVQALSALALPDVGNSSGAHGALTSPCLAFSRDGSRLAASGYRDVRVWSL